MRTVYDLVLIFLCILFGAVLLSLAMPAAADTVIRVCSEKKLRDAVDAGGNITFACSGSIQLTNHLSITKPTVLDCSTSPNMGIQIIGGWTVQVLSSDVVIRGCKLRPGPNPNNFGVQVLSIGGHFCGEIKDVLIESNSLLWGTDQNSGGSGYEGPVGSPCEQGPPGRIGEIVYRWNIIAEGLKDPYGTGDHSMGSLWDGNIPGPFGYYENLFAHNVSRNPQVIPGRPHYSDYGLVVDTRMFFHDNVNYHTQYGLQMGLRGAQHSLYADVQGNRFIAGDSPAQLAQIPGYPKIQVEVRPDTDGPVPVRLQWNTTKSLNPRNPGDPECYVAATGTNLRCDGENPSSMWVSNAPPEPDPEVETLRILSLVGPRNGGCLDPADARIVQDALNGLQGNPTGLYIDDPSDVGGWPNTDLQCE